MEMIKTVNSINQRSFKFFKLNQDRFRRDTELATEDALQNNGLQLSLLGNFYEMGGFQKLIDLIKVGGVSPEFKCPILVMT
jgi:hypothetical protein